MTLTTMWLLVLGGAAAAVTTLPQGGQIRLELASDRETYHVGEPVELTLTAHNAGDTPLSGYLELQPYLPTALKTASLLYCRGGQPCLEFLATIPHVEKMDLAVTPTTLRPGDHQQSRFVVALNPANGLLVLDTPGDYEFRWVSRGIHEHPRVGTRMRGQQVSASTFVRVLPVPRSEQEAFTYYAENRLGELAQYDLSYFVYTDKLRLAAHGLLTRYPDSIYAAAIRRGFLELLENRARAGRATPEDSERLTELRARRSER